MKNSAQRALKAENREKWPRRRFGGAKNRENLPRKGLRGAENCESPFAEAMGDKFGTKIAKTGREKRLGGAKKRLWGRFGPQMDANLRKWSRKSMILTGGRNREAVSRWDR